MEFLQTNQGRGVDHGMTWDQLQWTLSVNIVDINVFQWSQLDPIRRRDQRGAKIPGAQHPITIFPLTRKVKKVVSVLSEYIKKKILLRIFY